MIVTSIITTAAATLSSPADVAINLSSLTENGKNQSKVKTCGSELEDKTKVGVSINYTYTYAGTANQRLDDSNSWD